MLGSLKELLFFWHPPKPPVPFSVLFKKFKSIVERNNRILELMADMGDKLGGEYVFDRQYILDVCERVSDLVFKLISDLCFLTQLDNVELFTAFERIQHEIQEELAGRHPFTTVRPTILLDEITSDLSEEVGNKFANLGDIRNVLGLPTPDGFVITTKAFFDFMEFNGLVEHIEAALARWDRKDDAAFTAMCKEVRRRILEAPVPRAVTLHVNAMLDIMNARHRGKSLHFAVRSSAWGEDGEFSFAGQYESVLHVSADYIYDAYRQVIASAYTPQAWQYRLHRNYREHEMAMAVGVQLMAGAEVSGALYTYAPLPQEQQALVVSAAWGLGPAVVQGIAESDTFVLDRMPPHHVVSEEIGNKTRMIVPGEEEGTAWEDVPEGLREVPCLSASRIEKLAQAVMIIERYYKRPQDVEWAFDNDGNLSILQSRPLSLRPEVPVVRTGIDDAIRSAQVIFSDKGTVVQRGIASGKVYVARDDEDLSDFPYGSILVTKYTSPKYARVMRMAQGIITDVGSPTGHMSTLAREYRIPTIVDTGIATTLLKTGDEITLDAGRNAVYCGTIHELSRLEFTEEDAFEESYEYRLLKRLVKKINELNLINRHSDNFKPNRCRTFHDITRYAHEKAVEKLIDLSENYQKYHDVTPKRLEVEIPLGLMIIDIESGAGVRGEARTVHFDEVTSVPLRALLEGLLKSGMWTTEPVPIDLGSFMSSVTRTVSATLAVPGRSDRNLAVVSKEYMNLNLKLGYHFTLLDAYIGDATNDNYLYFRFLGGVTNFLHRSRRAKFIAGVLEYLDFRVEVHGDLVVGRLKKISKERMYGKMKVLGGLIGYTRQLDAGMTGDDLIARYHTDFIQRIQPLLEVKDGCST